VHVRGHRHGGDGDPAGPDGPLARAGLSLHRPRCAEDSLLQLSLVVAVSTSLPFAQTCSWHGSGPLSACCDCLVHMLATRQVHPLSWLRLPSGHERSVLSGALLKEAIDDLEWAAAGGHQSARSAVHLVMRRDPKALTLFAKGAGELKVMHLVRHMTCVIATVSAGVQQHIAEGEGGRCNAP